MTRCVVVVCRPSRKQRSGLGRWDVREARCVGLGGEMRDFLQCEWTRMVTKHLCTLAIYAISMTCMAQAMKRSSDWEWKQHRATLMSYSKLRNVG